MVYNVYIMTLDVNEKLGQFLREGQDWEKKPTNIPGASLLKLPTFKKSSIYRNRNKSNKCCYWFSHKEKRNNN
ncbi:MAG: hypothetical protein ACJ72Q_01990 [Nitrososphaeraceae archaeon]